MSVAVTEEPASGSGTAHHARVCHPATPGTRPGALVPQRGVPRAESRLPAGIP